MKTRILLLFVWLLFLASSCTDRCKETHTFRQYTPVSFSFSQVRQGVQVEQPRLLVNPGKIYAKDGFLFINEVKEGIHVIDNRNPSTPRTVSFLKIPGNGDIAIRDNILYADSYMDLLAFDISDLQNIREIKRLQDVFQSGQFEGGWWSANQQDQLVNDQKVDYVTETIKTNCDEENNTSLPWREDRRWVDRMPPLPSALSMNSSSGVGGSMARFALYDNYLYTISQSDMQLVNIRNPADPQKGNLINLGWDIETIFPYKDKLFIGAQSGMHIYDNSNPEKPVRMSTFQHATVCDPVAVHDNLAYVTLRSGTTCQGYTNQLDVVDISNLYNPRLLKSYPMQNPHGLGIDFPTLFICEGAYGLKTFDAADPLSIDKNQLEHLKGFQAYDVIPLKKSLLLIGKDGFYQYDYSNPRKLRLLSKIPVNRPYPQS